MNNTLKQIAAQSVDLVKDKNGKTDNSLSTDVVKILNGIIATLGLACVVVMIIGGVTYMTSNGDTGKVEKGKKTILYGLIGLTICVLSFAIVNFTISNIIDNGSSSQSSDKKDDKDNKSDED